MIDDPSGESCTDDPPNEPQESGVFRPDEHDSVFEDSDEETTSEESLGCAPEAESESPHATNTADIAMHTTEKDVNRMCITTPTGNRLLRTPDFRR